MLDLSTRWKCIVNFTSSLFYLQQKRHHIHWTEGWVGLSEAGHCGVEANFLLLLRSNPVCPSCSPNELSHLPEQNIYISNKNMLECYRMMKSSFSSLREVRSVVTLVIFGTPLQMFWISRKCNNQDYSMLLNETLIINRQNIVINKYTMQIMLFPHYGLNWLLKLYSRLLHITNL
jgi:hypothetical protein